MQEKKTGILKYKKKKKSYVSGQVVKPKEQNYIIPKLYVTLTSLL
jgi:hypothetical protein